MLHWSTKVNSFFKFPNKKKTQVLRLFFLMLYQFFKNVFQLTDAMCFVLFQQKALGYPNAFSLCHFSKNVFQLTDLHLMQDVIILQRYVSIISLFFQVFFIEKTQGLVSLRLLIISARCTTSAAPLPSRSSYFTTTFLICLFPFCDYILAHYTYNVHFLQIKKPCHFDTTIFFIRKTRYRRPHRPHTLLRPPPPLRKFRFLRSFSAFLCRPRKFPLE